MKKVLFRPGKRITKKEVKDWANKNDYTFCNLEELKIHAKEKNMYTDGTKYPEDSERREFIISLDSSVKENGKEKFHYARQQDGKNVLGLCWNADEEFDVNCQFLLKSCK